MRLEQIQSPEFDAGEGDELLPGSGLRVLIVEDDEDDLELTISALRAAGIRCDWRRVMTGTELEQALQQADWDLVLCDHYLPAFDSRSALALVRARRPELPFIVVSGAFSDQDSLDALAAGVDAVVSKSSLVTLPSVIRRALREQRSAGQGRTASTPYIERAAYFDAVTGLPNERRFLRELDRISAARPAERFAVVIAEARYSDHAASRIGSSAHISLLVRLSEQLRRCVPPNTRLAALGDQRFAMIVAAGDGAPGLLRWIDELRLRLPRAALMDGTTLPLRWNIGACLYPEHGLVGVQLLSRAQIALEKSIYDDSPGELFDETMASAPAEPHRLDALQRALQRDEFFLVYQPQFDLRSGRKVAAEALLRWHHPELGIILPTTFVPTLEQSGLIVPVGNWVIRSACQQAAQWRRHGWRNARVAVNVAMLQLEDDGLVQTVKAALRDAAIPAEALELEITESIAATNQARVVHALGELRQLGVSVALDDFGTGYSSLAYLKHFTLDKLKIDKVFVQGMDADPRDRALVRAAIAMAHELGLEVVAEGVECAEHARFLRDLHCEYAQGYYLGRPARPELI